MALGTFQTSKRQLENTVNCKMKLSPFKDWDEPEL